MMRWLFRLFACRHHEMIRERDDAGVLWLTLVCAAIGLYMGMGLLMLWLWIGA